MGDRSWRSKATHHHSLYVDLTGQLGASRKMSPTILFWLLKWTHKKSSWRGLSKLSSLLQVYWSDWGHCSLTRLVMGRMIWELEAARYPYINLLRAKWASTMLPSSSLTQIPPSVKDHLKVIRKRNCGNTFFQL